MACQERHLCIIHMKICFRFDFCQPAKNEPSPSENLGQVKLYL